MLPLARHTLLELHGCDPALLRDSAALQPLMIDAVRRGSGTIVTEIFHNFSPHGVSGVVVISESHVAIHTWPEHGFAAVDIFSCSRSLDVAAIQAALEESLRPTSLSARTIERGSNIHGMA